MNFALQEMTDAQGEEDEGKTSFDFNTWVIDNGLNEIKDKLIEHGLITVNAMNTSSTEFKSFISDPLVLSTKNYLLPQLFAAIDKIPVKRPGYVSAHYIYVQNIN